jgi:hypothetical protein
MWRLTQALYRSLSPCVEDKKALWIDGIPHAEKGSLYSLLVPKVFIHSYSTYSIRLLLENCIVL